nr:hypothetical protein GCM10025732_30180 [Glycomyces mayteni]
MLLGGGGLGGGEVGGPVGGVLGHGDAQDREAEVVGAVVEDGVALGRRQFADPARVRHAAEPADELSVAFGLDEDRSRLGGRARLGGYSGQPERQRHSRGAARQEGSPVDGGFGWRLCHGILAFGRGPCAEVADRVSREP